MPFAKIILVLLRLAIGWHLLYEGLYKLDSHESDHPWSAQPYLERSEGPFRELFRELAREYDHRTEFDEAVITKQWSQHLDRFNQFYRLDADQRESAEGESRLAEQRLKDQLYNDPQTRSIVKKYTQDLMAIPGSLTTGEQKRLTAYRELLRRKVAGLTENLEAQLLGLLTPEQHKRGDLPVTASTIDIIDQLVIWGLILSGACLIIGLFSRLAALGGAAMLMMFYLAMPPLPGLTAATEGTSHYLYVDKNLVELLALLLLVSTNSGRWAGLDVLVRAAVTAPLLGIFQKKQSIVVADDG